MKKEQIWQEWKSQPCAHCGQRFHWSMIDAHHVDPTTKESDKRFSIKTMAIEDMRAELDKCIPLCKNCHAWHHWKEGAVKRIKKTEGKSCPWPRPKRQRQRVLHSAEVESVLRRWRRGETYGYIGSCLGICPKTAKAIVTKYKRA